MSHGDYIENNEDIIVDGVDENQIFVSFMTNGNLTTFEFDKERSSFNTLYSNL